MINPLPDDRRRPAPAARGPQAAALAAALVLLAAGGVRAGYRYGGYTPLGDHAGERAVVDAPRCGVKLENPSDHDAAYVDVSNEKATQWGQAGWWLGTSGSGRFFGSPVGYIEYRLSDGTYLWQSLGPPPPGARYSVANSGLVMHDETGRTLPLYRITASFVAGILATYPYPGATGDNAGLAESYSSGSALEPIGPATYRDVELDDDGRWKLWLPTVDGAARTASIGDRLSLQARWHRWRVEGRLGFAPVSAPTAVRPSPVARWPRARDTGGWRLFAPPSLFGPGAAVQVGTLAADVRGRLVGTALRADGRMLLWRWQPTSAAGSAARVWTVGDRRAELGGGGAAAFAPLEDGGMAYAAGKTVLWLPPREGDVRETRLVGGALVHAASTGPDDSVALLRGKAPLTLELWRAPPGGGTDGRARRVARLVLPAAVGRPDAMVYQGGGRWLLDRPDSVGGAYGAMTEVTWRAGQGAVRLRAVPVPALYLAAAGGMAAVSGGDRARGARVRSDGSPAWRAPRPLNGAAAWGDVVALSPDGRVWTSTRRAGATELYAWRRDAGAVHLALPPFWVRQEAPSPGAVRLAAPAYVTSLAAGRGWIAAAPQGQGRVLVAFDRSRATPAHGRRAPRCRPARSR